MSPRPLRGQAEPLALDRDEIGEATQRRPLPWQARMAIDWSSRSMVAPRLIKSRCCRAQSRSATPAGRGDRPERAALARGQRRAPWRSSATEEAVFEGHDSRLVERERLRQAGFAAVDPVDTSERSRPILLTRKR